MNQDILAGNWKQLRGQLRETWGSLTGDDVDRIAGSGERLAGALQERYGWTKDEAARRVSDFVARFGARGESEKRAPEKARQSSTHENEEARS